MKQQTASSEVVGLEDIETLDSVVSCELLLLASAGATGELVCRCERGEAHVFLQRGRVAWANDAEHRRAFTAYLKQHAHIDTATMEEVVAECQAAHRPIGETLLAKGLATQEQVRAALRHQIGLALHVGRCDGKGPCAFATRDYHDYDARFTFDAVDVVADVGGVA